MVKFIIQFLTYEHDNIKLQGAGQKKRLHLKCKRLISNRFLHRVLLQKVDKPFYWP
jgi:hypothetical protein